MIFRRISQQIDRFTIMDILISEKAFFDIEVPYKLIESGKTGINKPLIIYLHGYNDHLESFKSKCSLLINQVEAYHLFIQGPYPVFNRTKDKKVEEWGRAWYLFDGDQNQFIRSMEKSSTFIEKILQSVKDRLSSNRTCLIGYSMGGYLAGYFALSRPDNVQDLIVAGARIKTEILEGDWKKINHLKVFAVHGANDNIVDYKPQRSEIRRLVDNGVSANFKLIAQKHIFNEEFASEIRDWLYEKGYVHTDSF